jgi:hypothetical protein
LHPKPPQRLDVDWSNEPGANYSRFDLIDIHARPQLSAPGGGAVKRWLATLAQTSGGGLASQGMKMGQD